MDPVKASLTALAASYMRAVHTRTDRPRLFDDPYGDRFVSETERAILHQRLLLSLGPEPRAAVEAIDDPIHALDHAIHFHPAYGAALVRVAYTESRLAAAIDSGVAQYVILGAGLDTFALRHPELGESLRVFEIDHPLTQQLKRDRFETAALAIPSNVTLLEADFESTMPSDALAESGFSAGSASFVAAHGLTPYLSREANARLLGSIAAVAAPGSSLVFDYLDARALGPVDALTDADTQRFVEERASSDEPFLSGFAPSEIPEILAAADFELQEDLGPPQVQALLGTEGEPPLRAMPFAHLVLARRHGGSS